MGRRFETPGLQLTKDGEIAYKGLCYNINRTEIESQIPSFHFVSVENGGQKYYATSNLKFPGTSPLRNFQESWRGTFYNDMWSWDKREWL